VALPGGVERARIDDRVVPASGDRSRLDLSRRVYAHLGLVFDAITLTDATGRLYDSAVNGQRCFFSTPNVNFVVTAMRDTAFRDAVLQSDLSIADGTLVVALGRWMGVPLLERVAGSDIFDALRFGLCRKPPISVFFFGGEVGAGESAARVLNSESGAMTCVGFLNPGFGTVESMSSSEIIDRINASRASFLVVSLGALKGQAWIQRCRGRLEVPLISHLGAVVNFVAGNVKRAPRWMRSIGLEWLWRIVSEPKLWRRYFDDGVELLKWVASSYSARRRLARPVQHIPPALRVDPLNGAPSRTCVCMSGNWTDADSQPLRLTLARLLRSGQEIRIDVASVADMDSAVLGVLALLHGWQRQTRPILTHWECINSRVADRARVLGMRFLFP
jgi:N-acetylglucosaminyldiphosphoundecaprenol N-acetyl-beta-D-mannosaminyltransferase